MSNETIVTVTEQEVTREPMMAVAKAMAARERGDLVECPWWFTYMAMSNPKFRKGSSDERGTVRGMGDS